MAMARFTEPEQRTARLHRRLMTTCCFKNKGLASCFGKTWLSERFCEKLIFKFWRKNFVSNRFDSLKPQRITDFRTLGTGRKKKTVVAADGNRILFIARVSHRNLATSKTVRFDNGKPFHTDSETIGGRKVYLFWPCEFLTDEWERQCKIDEIEVWIKDAAVKDVFTFLDCVTLVCQKRQPGYHLHVILVFAQKEIKLHLEFLSLPELRLLTSILDDVGCGKAA
jgi:hypothetical protein